MFVRVNVTSCRRIHKFALQRKALHGFRATAKKKVEQGTNKTRFRQGHFPVLHCAPLMRIIYGVISARSCTCTLKTWTIYLDIELILSVEVWP